MKVLFFTFSRTNATSMTPFESELSGIIPLNTQYLKMIFIVPRINFDTYQLPEPHLYFPEMFDIYKSCQEDKEYWKVMDHTKIQFEVTCNFSYF